MGSPRPRNSTRARKARSVKSAPKTRGKPPATSMRSKRRSAPDLPSVVHRSLTVPAITLVSLRSRLNIILSSARVVASALRAQNCEVNGDAAGTMNFHVVDALSDQIKKLDSLLKGVKT